MLAVSRAKRVLSAGLTAPGAGPASAGPLLVTGPAAGVSAGAAGKGCPAFSGLGLLMDERLWQ